MEDHLQKLEQPADSLIMTKLTKGSVLDNQYQVQLLYLHGLLWRISFIFTYIVLPLWHKSDSCQNAIDIPL